MPPSDRPLTIEPLELRRLRASIVFADHLLTVDGAGNAPSTITVGGSVELSTVVATVTWQTGPARHPQVHTLSKTIPLSQGIQAVHINGGDRADVITIDQTYEPFTIATTMNGGGGKDTITGGDEPDVVYGQGGADHINGGGGNDLLIGGAGNDVLIGGPGDDFLAGDGGRDYLEGDAGDDTLRDARGPDTVLGGAGQNTFDIHSLRRDIDNDFNTLTDTLHIVNAPGTGDSDDTGFLGGLFPISSLL